MSLAVMGKLSAGDEDPGVDATIVKDLGTSFEQELPRLVQANARPHVTLESGDPFNDTLSYLAAKLALVLACAAAPAKSCAASSPESLV